MAFLNESVAMTSNLATRVSALTGFLAVALGAFGAHALKGVLAQNNTEAVWETAVLYHFIHGLILFALAARTPFQAGPWWCFLVGILIFSGSLYLLAALNIRWLGAITPLGGLSFLAGWLWLMIQPIPKKAP